MGGGSKQPAVQKQEITQSTLPEYARPYYEGLMQRASTQLTTPYTPYDQERIAGFTPQQQQLQQNILNQQTPGQFGAASTLAATAGLGSLQAGQYTPGQFGSQQIGMPNLQQYSMSAPMMGSTREVGALGVGAPGMQSAQSGYKPNLQNFQMGKAGNVSAGKVNASTMQGARTSFGQGPLEQFRMEGPEQFGGVQAERYMSPFQQNVTDIQKREAIRDAQKGQIVQDLGAARQGTYGGSRQLLAGLERERNLGTQLGDIQARGSQAAYENAQAQFERDRAAGMTTDRENLQAALGQQQLGVSTGMQAALANLSNEQQARVNNQALQFQAQGMSAENALRASLANQQAGLTTGQQNLAAKLGVQQLGAEQSLQTNLANLTNEQQARVNTQALQFQAQGMNADNALRAALANQGADLTRAQLNQQAQLTAGQQNLGAALDTQRLGAQTGLAALQSNQQANLDMQRMFEQSRQFGAGQQLAGLGQAGQMAQTLSNIGTGQSQADQARFGMQQSTAAQQQALQQQYLDTAYQDFLRQRDYPAEQMQQYSSLLRGVPVTPSSTTTTYAPSPGIAQQIMGTGLGALGMYKTLGG
jgi:hypothetical protein